MKTTITRTSSPESQIIEFTTQTQIQLFTTFKRSRFSGKLILRGGRDEEWTFYFYLGRFLYATGGEHRYRRWERSLLTYSSDMYYLWLQKGIPKECNLEEKICLSNLKPNICWEYQVLCSWVAARKITREQALNNIRLALTETLFDVRYERRVSYQIIPDKSLSAKLIFSDAGHVIRDVHQQWVAWQQSRLVDRSPNSAPVIQNPELFQTQVPQHVYKSLVRLLNGQHTLRDIALKMKRDVTAVTAYLLPYIQSGVIQLKHIPDFQGLDTVDSDDVEPHNEQEFQNILVACIDDSPLICQTMEQIIREAGYNFVSVNDPLRAIAILLSRKPEIIFLDLVMPNANGYEICTQLRKLSFFKNTPIVILTGNDGIVDRVRAKLVGSSDFISKPVDRDAVLSMIKKHIHLNSSKR